MTQSLIPIFHLEALLSNSNCLFDVRSCLPRELDGVFLIDIGPLDLRVVALNHVPIFEVPLSVALGLIIVELAFEVRLVRVDPLSLHQLA